MRKNGILLSFVLALIGTSHISAQTSSNPDLSTRCIGVPPAHTTVNSVAQWMENPVDQTLQIAVTNLYAYTNDYMEIDIGGQHVIFYGAGTDMNGNFIPTNYPPVTVNAILRREYPMSITCPNSGPNHSPLFNLNDFSDPDSRISALTNGTYAPLVSAFVWSNFTVQDQNIFTNGDPATMDGLRQTNLVLEMNRIITGPSIYDSQRFAGITLGPDTQDLLAQNPTDQRVWQLNRWLLRDALQWPANDNPSDYSGTAQITFFVQPPPELRIKKNQPAPSYTILFNRDSSSGGVLNLVNPGAGYVSTNYSTIEIVKDKFGRFGLGDGCDDATKAPGQGNWLNLGPGCTQDTNRISLEWHVSLGRTFDGLAAGQLAFREPELSQDSYTPYAIYYNAAYTNIYTETTLGSAASSYVPTNLVILVTTNIPNLATNSAGDVYTNYDNLLRQVKACQTFVDILTPDTNQTVLNFYLAGQVGTNQDANGLYTNFFGSPFVTWTIQNPESATANKLNIIENRNGTVTTQSLVKASSAGGVTWTLTLGSGSEQRVETRQVSFTGGSIPTNRIELNTIQYANSSTPAYQCQETYNFYPWGSELVQTSIPNGSSPLVTTYEYYDKHDGSDPDDPYSYGYGCLKLIVYPDGYWEKRLYGVLYENDYYSWGGFLSCQILHPYFDGADGGATSPDSATPDNSAMQAIPFYSWYFNNCVSEQEIERYDHGKYVGGIISGMIDNGQTTESFCSSGPDDGLDYSSEVNFYWDYIFSSSPPGLAGHTEHNSSTLLYQQFYYDHGIFDQPANVFIVDTNNHLYTWEGMATNYPDHLETEIDQPTDFWGDDASFLGDLTADIPGYEPQMDYYQEIDDHPFSQMAFYPGATRKHTRIYHAGNLVQTEEYVYSSGTEVDQYFDCSDPQWALLSKIRYYTDSLGRATNVVLIDPISGQTRTLYTADYRGNNNYDGELLLSETDEAGQQKTYTYDSLQRIKSVTIKGYGNQPDQVATYTRDANGQITNQTVTAGSLSQTESWAYDLAGRVTNQVDQSGIATQISYSADGLTTTNTSPGGIQVIQQNSSDRFPLSVQGNGTVAKYYEHDTTAASTVYAQEKGAGLREQTTYMGHENSPRWKTQGTDIPGNSDAWQVWPMGSGTTNTASLTRWYVSNRLLNERYEAGLYSGSGVNRLINHNYDVGGQECLKSTYADNWSDNRMTASIRSVININGNWYQATTNIIYLTDTDYNSIGTSDMTIQSIELEQLNGFAANVMACTIDYDADNNETITTTTVDRNNNKITTVTSQPNTSSLNATTICQNGLPISSSTLSVASPTLYCYDALGRTNQIISPLGYSAYINYDPVTGWVTSMTDFTGQTTSYQYYNTNEANAGKLKCQTSATGKKTYYAYTTQGQLYQTWGDVPYPAQYNYNEYGDLTNLVTFRGGSGWTSSTWPANPGTGDNTYWIYDEASGVLLQKIDAQNNAVTYTYDTITGRLLTRSWGRMTTVINADNTVSNVAVTVTNSYDGFDDLVSQQYNDGTPNVYFNNYNRAGLPREIIDGTGTNELTYDYASRLVSSTCINGLLNGITVSNHFNPFYGRDAVAVLGLNSSLEDDFTYESSSGRLSSVGSGPYLAVYGYAPNSDLLQTTTCYSNSTTVLTTTRTWDYGMRLRSIANMVGSAPVTSHSYQYDALNRRTQATLEDGSYWSYGYDDRDELTSASRKWSASQNNTPVSGQQFNYAYDNIGNRQTAGFGGDTNGANLRTITYTNNSLNQYIGILMPSYENIIGAALITNNVTVNGVVADRKLEYFHQEITVANGSGPIWQNVTNISGTFTNTGGLLVPASSQVLTYDADGNLSSDSIWTYQWDGENRLISMIMTNNVAGIATTNQLRLDFAYDFMGRRVQKIVSVWNVATNNYVPTTTNCFIYDGWNLLAIINPQSSILQSFVWGKDLSGTMTKAGGVGGLLMSSIPGTNCFATYDGNGNITALINTLDKSLAARYEYSPYGELLRETGLLAHQNPFRFSTKFWDEESGLIYYGYRYYGPSIGRWINRDPNGEKDNRNMHGFVHNNPIITIDTNGKEGFIDFIEDLGDAVFGLPDGSIYPQIPGMVLEHFDPESFMGFLGETIGSGVSDQLAAITINFAPNDMLLADIGSEVQEINFDENAQNIITSRLQTQTAINNFIGLVVGIAANAVNANGGNGDDLILDASLNAAATTGVDSSETIYGVASDIAD